MIHDDSHALLHELCPLYVKAYATRNNYLVYYQLFYVFIQEFSLPYTVQNARLWAEGMAEFWDDPHRIALQISKVPGMKIPKREKKLITNEGLAAIFAQPKDTKIGTRDKTIMVLLYDSAVRVCELTGLRINDVDLKTLSIHINGKGNKERSVAISEKTAAHLKRYMSIYHSEGSKPDDYLFYTVIKER